MQRSKIININSIQSSLILTYLSTLFSLGSLYDRFQVYDHAFYMAGATMLFSAFLSLPLSGQLRAARHKGQLARLAEILGTDDLKRPVYLSSLVVNVEAPDAESNKNSCSQKNSTYDRKQVQTSAPSPTPSKQPIGNPASTPNKKYSKFNGGSASTHNEIKDKHAIPGKEPTISKNLTDSPISTSRLYQGVEKRRKRRRNKNSDSTTPLTSRLDVDWEDPYSNSASLLIAKPSSNNCPPYLSLTNMDTLQTIPVEIDSYSVPKPHNSTIQKKSLMHASPPNISHQNIITDNNSNDKLIKKSKMEIVQPGKSKPNSYATLPSIKE